MAAILFALGIAYFTLASCQSDSSTQASGDPGILGSHAGVPSVNATFDYVVVGGGTAGLTIATRLAESGTFTVAVIEAGGFYEVDNGNLSTVPGTAGYYIGTAPVLKNPLIDWQYQTQPDTGLGGRSIFYNSGKTLGGGSARNYMVYDRGTKGSYQRWADEVNDQSYTFENFLPYFQKSVHFDVPNLEGRAGNATPKYNADVIGHGGPLHVSFFSWANTIGSWVKLALRDLGLREIRDFNSGDLFGYQYTTVTVDGPNQTRSSSESSFLRQALNENVKLTVYKSTLAKRILFNASKHATGVLVDTSGQQYLLSARKEVIVSAGAHRSPQLLMVSGIGPRPTLEQFQIPVLSDLPGVGQNMWDQVFFGPSYPVGLVTHSALANPAFLAAQEEAYQVNRTGLLTNSGSDFLAWENLPKEYLAQLSPATREGLAQFPNDWPQILHTIADAWYGYGRDLVTGAPTDGRMYVSVLPTLMAPFSRGNVTISSKDTAQNPVISPNLLNDRRDQEVAVAAFKRARQIFRTPALRAIITGDEAFPGPNVTTNEQILSVIMQSSSTIWHAAATNKMGTTNDPMAVLDSQARVRGVRGLRVVDASAFPLLVPCHPQATVYALAEKIADLILKGSGTY